MSASSATETLNAYGPVSAPHISDRKNAKSVLSEVFGSRRSSMAANPKRGSETSSISSSAGDASRKGSAPAVPAPPKSKNELKLPTLIMPPMRFYN
ncbi:hypothetical protein TOPH_02329 [Tolypocladium ophioglossoides CBS 100239]|uniref:Uncharacterized protein n=1 Tax=Tolypocladium ophioglossoides (strain CBS 100239) TaxID=1163406 RepID=A0A0L0NHV7_TOLOC|nr:hypothetical protein TOPH_02329 [Tolypocladium ophioglossoides CBS 100239]